MRQNTIALGANDAWNLVNYRAGLITALQGSRCEDGGYRAA